MKVEDKQRLRDKRRRRIRYRVNGTSDRPRLSVFRSSKHIYAQIIDDDSGRTLAAASTLDASYRGTHTGADRDAAKAVGALIAERAKGAGIARVVFDRGGYQYHGRVKSLAESAREAGLEF